MISERRRLSLCGLVAAAAVSGACGGGDGTVPVAWVGHPGDKLPALTASSVLWVEGGIDGAAPLRVIVDTGAPFTLLDVDAYGGAVPLGLGRVAALSLGDAVFWKALTVGTRQPTGPSVAPNGQLYGGIVGHSVFGQFAVSFNYRDGQVVLAEGSPPDGVEPPLNLSFSLEGGGLGSLPDGAGVLTFPPSRVIVQAIVEGTPRTLLLDTGASWVALRSPLYQAIAQDGRGQTTEQASLAQGETTTNIMRLRSVSLGGAEVDAAIMGASGQAVDQLLDSLAIEVGHTIDGLLGGPFLRNFFVTIDYPNRRLELRRYASESFIHDEYHRVGVDLEVTISPGAVVYQVGRVYPGTDAEKKGINVGDRIVSIDGTPLTSHDAGAVEQLLLGDVGSSHRLVLANKTIDVSVDDVLPLP